jgi:microcystin-dependent protein
VTGVGDAPRDLREFVVNTRKRLVALERRQGGGGGGGGGGGSSVQAGMIQPFAGSVLPTGWLLCDGAEVNRITYASLFAAIGTVYGAGNGSTTFNLPNLKGRVPFGKDPSQVEFDVLGETGGAKVHRHDFAIGMFDKNWSPAGEAGGMNQSGAAWRAGAYRSSTETYSGGVADGTGTTNVNTGINNGGAVSVTTSRFKSQGDTAVPTGTSGLPPYQIVNYIISIGAGSGSGGGTTTATTSIVTDWNAANTPGLYRAAAGTPNAPQPTYPMTGTVLETSSGVQQRIQIESALVVNGGRNQWYRTMTGSTWSAWLRTDRLMIPGSIVGGTFDPVSGRTNLTTNSVNWSFNNVFTTEFRTYRILFQYFNGNTAGGGFRLRRSGTDHTASAYQYSGWYTSGTALGPATGTTDQGFFPATSGQGGHGEITVSEPMYTAGDNVQKRIRGLWAMWGPVNYTELNSSLGSADTTAFDGFSLYITGSVGVTAASHSWISVEGLA